MTQTGKQHFMNLPPELRRADESRYAILPVPYDDTASYLKGSARAPEAIIDASSQVEDFDEELRADYRQAGIVTLDAVAPADTPGEQMKRVYEAAKSAGDKFIIALGGEHSITAPLVQAAAEKHAGVSVLQIDAHADLRDAYDGTKHSHACVMRRVLEITNNIAQVGIRNFSREEFLDCPRQVENFITPLVVETDTRWIDRTLDLLGDTVYITIDVDGFDPCCVPGTGTPEPGGLTWRQVTTLLRRVCSLRRVIGADIVEVVPLEGQKVSEFLAARLAYKIIAYTQSGPSAAR